MRSRRFVSKSKAQGKVRPTSTDLSKSAVGGHAGADAGQGRYRRSNVASEHAEVARVMPQRSSRAQALESDHRASWKAPGPESRNIASKRTLCGT
eukprot:scaffold13908_cov106-Isochrysis_galbana.AAC.9